MDLESVKAKYKEFFSLANEPKEPHLQAILFFHSINILQGMLCTGCLEDDSVENYELPPDWSKDIDGVHSLRYQSKEQSTLYFKFIVEGDTLDVNAINSSDPGILQSATFKISEFKDENLEKILKQYMDEIITKLLPQYKPKGNEGTNIIFEERKEPDRIRDFRDAQRGKGGFGDYGKSDIRPVPLDPLGIGSMGGTGIGTGVGGGSLFGPNNPIFTSGPEYPERPELKGKVPGAIILPTGPGNIDPTYPDDDHFQPRGIPVKKPQGGIPDPFGGGFGTKNRFGNDGFGPSKF